MIQFTSWKWNATESSIKFNFVDNGFFCDPKHKLHVLFVLDYKERQILSMYGCKIIEVDGVAKKLEGVFILADRFYNNSSIRPTIPYTLYETTNKIVKDQLNISLNRVKLYNGVNEADGLILFQKRVNDCNMLKPMITSSEMYVLSAVLSLPVIVLIFMFAAHKIFGLWDK